MVYKKYPMIDNFVFLVKAMFLRCKQNKKKKSLINNKDSWDKTHAFLFPTFFFIVYLNLHTSGFT